MSNSLNYFTLNFGPFFLEWHNQNEKTKVFQQKPSLSDPWNKGKNNIKLSTPPGLWASENEGLYYQATAPIRGWQAPMSDTILTLTIHAERGRRTNAAASDIDPHICAPGQINVLL